MRQPRKKAAGLAALAVLACAACCAIPLFAAAGVAGVAAAITWNWVVALAGVMVVGGLTWSYRRRRSQCTGGDCECHKSTDSLR